jgi:uncharacterized protein YbjT (DUF2867 family)
MNILVLGAAGKTGREVLARSLAAGHTVTAFVRDRRSLTAPTSRLQSEMRAVSTTWARLFAARTQ